MTEWVRVGSRYVNLANVVEVHAGDRPPVAQIFYIGGGTLELRDEDADLLRALLEERALALESPHRRVIAPAG